MNINTQNKEKQHKETQDNKTKSFSDQLSKLCYKWISKDRLSETVLQVINQNENRTLTVVIIIKQTVICILMKKTVLFNIATFFLDLLSTNRSSSRSPFGCSILVAVEVEIDLFICVFSMDKFRGFSGSGSGLPKKNLRGRGYIK